MNKGWDMKKEITYQMPVRPFQETFQPLALELPLPSPDYYERMQPKNKEKETASDRGVWTIDI